MRTCTAEYHNASSFGLHQVLPSCDAAGSILFNRLQARASWTASVAPYEICSGLIRFACSVTNASLAGGRARLRGRRHSIGGSSRSDVVKLRGLQQTTDETVVRSCCTGNSAIRTASVQLTHTVVSATLYAPRPRASLYRVGSGLELLCAPDGRIRCEHSLFGKFLGEPEPVHDGPTLLAGCQQRDLLGRIHRQINGAQ